MASKVLLSQTNAMAVGVNVSFAGSDNIRVVQFNPMITQGFTGTVTIEQSFSTSPAATDYVTLLTVDFTGRTSDLVLDVVSNAPSLRARVSAYISGGMAVYGESSSRTSPSGGQGSSVGPTAIVTSSSKVAGAGNTFKINSVVVPAFTSDDIVYAGNFNLTLTDVLNGTNGATGKQDKIGTITATAAEINTLAGSGVVSGSFAKLAALNASATELNYTTGVTSAIQTQLNAITAAQPTGSLAGMTTTGATLDAFFNATPTVTITNLNNIAGLTATAADLNHLTGTSGTFNAADLTKLGNINASAVEINKLVGFTGTSTDLNALSGLTASITDLNAITGLAASGVSNTQLSLLSGLTQNVQAYITAQPSMSGLTASVNDLNILRGAFAGTGSYTGAISSTELSYLDGLTSNIQTQLTGKRNIGTAIGIAEISGASITITEFNYLSGATSNIQAQFNAITTSGNYITQTGGGTLTVPLFMSNGLVTAPSMAFAGATSTGLYKFGTGIGFAVAGVQMGSLDSANFIVGNGTTAGTPTIRGTAQGVLNPAYSFTGDNNTGMYWIGADSLGIGTGGKAMATFTGGLTKAVVLGGAAVDNNTVSVSGMFAGEKVLGTANIVAGIGSPLGQTPLYTVPTGRTAIVTKVIVILSAVAGFVDATTLRMNVGFGAGWNEIVDNTTNTTIFNNGTYTFGTTGQVLPLGTGSNTFPAISGATGAAYQTLSATAILKADLTATANSTQFNMKLVVMGYEY